MKTPQIMPCPCGGDGLIKPMPELKPLTFFLDNSNNLTDDTLFGIFPLTPTIGFSFAKSTPPDNVNNLPIAAQTIAMLGYFPVRFCKIDVLVCRPSQFQNPLKFYSFNHNIQHKEREITFDNTIANTQANPLLRSIEIDFTLKPNTGISYLVNAGYYAYLTLHPKQVVTS